MVVSSKRSLDLPPSQDSRPTKSEKTLETSDVIQTDLSCAGQCGRIFKSSCYCAISCFKTRMCCDDYSSECIDPDDRKSLSLSHADLTEYEECSSYGVKVVSNCSAVTDKPFEKSVQHSPFSQKSSQPVKGYDFIPVTDIVKGVTYSNIAVYNCFSSSISKPAFWATFAKEVAVVIEDPYIYLMVKQLCFQPPENVWFYFETCSQEGEQVAATRLDDVEPLRRGTEFESANHTFYCIGSQNALVEAKNNLYPISVFANEATMLFVSDNPNSTWYDIECDTSIVLQMAFLFAPHTFSCLITDFLFRSLTQSSSPENSKELYIFKFGLDITDHNSPYLLVHNQLLLCLLNSYAGMQVEKLWRPSQLTYIHAAKKHFYVLKVLVYDNMTYQNQPKSVQISVLNKITRIWNYLLKYSEMCKSRSDCAVLTFAAETTDFLDVARGRHFTKFTSQLFEGVLACACSESLRDVTILKYLESWICATKCILFTLNAANATDDLTDDLTTAARLCHSTNQAFGNYDRHTVLGFIFAVLLIIFFI